MAVDPADTLIASARVLLGDATARESQFIEATAASRTIPSDFVFKAAVKYFEGATLLQQAWQLIGNDAIKKKESVAKNAELYSKQSEGLKQKHSKTVMRSYRIPDNSTGYDFAGIFGDCIDAQLTSVVVEDPYIVENYQVLLFINLCELLVTSAQNLKHITLVTSEKAKFENFENLRTSLSERGITLIVTKNSTIHDREVLFDNGWIVKIGRGLNIYKPTKPFTLGAGNQAFRPCRETNVEVLKLVLK
ncbi:hypothetical protein L596_018550 [Steinernema carpocapsae]|uniref:MITD1 C-terminal phospholipase D-like domain-containing protein n=1 Tax=Steinernema carpocapsae TaxID=34508 RepID=A0A4V6A223_STECR|nr:hypothetical protein L596_018550 [Steinernema carpocapsae]